MIFEKIFKEQLSNFSREIENVSFNSYWEKSSFYEKWEEFKWYLKLKWANYDEIKWVDRYNFLLKTTFDKTKIWDKIISKDNDKFKVKLINKKEFDKEKLYEIYLEKIESA